MSTAFPCISCRYLPSTVIRTDWSTFTRISLRRSMWDLSGGAEVYLGVGTSISFRIASVSDRSAIIPRTGIYNRQYYFQNRERKRPVGDHSAYRHIQPSILLSEPRA